MPYQIQIAKKVEKELAALPKAVAARIFKKISGLSDNPRPRGVEKLKGKDALYRIRSGDYRVVYEIDDKVILVTVLRVRHRRKVYD